jgi:hypothetical protein
VTAYNHGPNGVLRAVDKVKSKNLQDIIDKYSGLEFWKK